MLEFIIANNRDFMFAVTFGLMVLLLLLEQIKPRRPEAPSQTSRWLNNIALTLFNFFLMTYVTVAVSMSDWVINLQPDMSLLQSPELNATSGIIITILTIELVGYWFHRVMHIVPLLWRVHSVHHSDTEVDVTTTHRHHPFEPVLSLIITLPVLILLGPPILAIIIYNLLHIVVSSITHSNIFVPKAIDRWLRYFIITPDFHRLHHVSQQQYTDSNYGAIFPWFDYLFGTATKLPFKEQETVQLGLKYFRKPIDSRVDHLLLSPFRWK